MYGVPSGAMVFASVLPTVLFVGMVMAGVVGVMSLAARKDVYDEIERGPGSVDREADATDGERAALAQDPGASERAERELEIRQMLEARSARMVRAGASPLDVEAELARLLGEDAGGEQALAGPQQAREQQERELEIRQMLEARSARMVRAGGSPLDVEAELARLLGDAAGGDGDQR